MHTIVDSHGISAQVADILAFHGVPSTQSVVRGEKTRYKVEVAPEDREKAQVLFPLRKWVGTALDCDGQPFECYGDEFDDARYFGFLRGNVDFGA